MNVTSVLSRLSVPSLQEDSSDLKCQLHFAKEESALMCKKLTKLVKDSDAMKEELAKYRSLYGDVNASLTVEEVRMRRTERLSICFRAVLYRSEKFVRFYSVIVSIEPISADKLVVNEQSHETRD